MKFWFRALFVLFPIVLASCGNHSSSAPVVYGADPNRQARIYNSPDEIYRKQQLERAQLAQRQAAQRQAAQNSAQRAAATRTASRNIEPVELTPISDVQYAAAEPVRLEKTKGYIEVQPGDTVYAVARRFNVTPKAVIDANNLRAPYTLSVGQPLKLPRGASIATTTSTTSTRTVVARDTIYTVRQGDTLYSISRGSRVPVDTIAEANRLRPPYALSVGQRIVVPSTPVGAITPTRATADKTRNITAKAQPQTRQAQTRQAKDMNDLTQSVSYASPEQVSPQSLFSWPVRGAIIAEYGPGEGGRRNEGVNIAAPAGTAVRAAADGEVVYRGAELEGYGNLLLVRHRDGFVTAYAHNDSMLVRKGQSVRKGQIIAKVGSTGAVKTPQLHFEIRRDRKSVDPVALLGSQ